MAYDLAFWKYKDDCYSDNQQVYESCCDDVESDILEVLPIDNILNDIIKSFSHWHRIDQSYFFENLNAPGAFNVETTSQFVRICCSNNMEGEDMNIFIDILLKYDCPLYDPQVAKRFDGK